MSKFAGMGVVGKGYIDKGLCIKDDNRMQYSKKQFKYAVYRSLGYMELVVGAAEASMNFAVNEVKELPDYSQSGEV